VTESNEVFGGTAAPSGQWSYPDRLLPCRLATATTLAYLSGGELFGETVARDSILDPDYLDEAVLYERIERVEIFCGYLARHSALPF
jgi:hypothetical protein